jgi:MFS family permease
VGFGAYRSVLGIAEVRRVLLLSFLVRIPLWAGNVVLTLHVVSHLHHSYAAAGFLVGVETVALAISAPWRGRRLDRVGLRAAVLPSLIVLTACWSVAPFMSYWPLLVLASIAGLFVVPSFSIVRQALIHAVPESVRTSALAVDSVTVELSFMIGPVVGVLLATYVDTVWALLGCELGSVLGGLLIWVMNPRLRDPSAETHRARARSWLSVAVFGVLLACLAATVVLSATDVSIVAALRHMGHQSWIGWELALWGLGSALGGLLYGALHRPLPLFLLLALLAGTTLPCALATNPAVLGVLLVISGFFCAPTITASVDTLSRLVPERVRGEAMGWHSSSMTTGSAIGAPIAGIAIDALGWQGGLIIPGLLGLAIALVGAVALRGRLPLGTPDGASATLGPAEQARAEVLS